jgi:surfactin synthase thioesterase subunit
MYYQSPRYRQEIINGVTQCLNSTYAKFIQSHPKFNGPVSIFAHSLGSVIAYDIITNWSPVRFYRIRVSGTQQILAHISGAKIFCWIRGTLNRLFLN